MKIYKKIYFTSILTIIQCFICNAAYTSDFDHNKLAIQNGCIHCHIEYVKEDELRSSYKDSYKKLKIIRSEASRWCISCHSDEARVCHKIGIVAPVNVNLPLEEGRLIGCITCHGPHYSNVSSFPWSYKDVQDKSRTWPFSRNNVYKTYLLHQYNTNGELCYYCHAKGGLNSKLNSYNFDKHNYSGHFARNIIHTRYVGSITCGCCHYKVYETWKTTPHARMTRKISEVEDLEYVNLEEQNYDKNKIEWVLGSHYVYRFVARATDTFVVLPKIWDRTNKKWLNVYDYEWHRRDWFTQCAGCHTTGYNIEEKSFVEPGISCESCHGPGYYHVVTGYKELIINPSKLDDLRKEMICMSCHTSGVDASGKYQFPVGYLPGDDLSKYYFGLTPKPGQDSKNFYGDETIEDRLRQWNFIKSRQLLAVGLTCDYCQNFRDIKKGNNINRKKDLYLSVNDFCQICHVDISLDHMSKHVTKKLVIQNTKCLDCHIPKTSSKGEISIHDHKFIFDMQK